MGTGIREDLHYTFCNAVWVIVVVDILHNFITHKK